MVYLIERNIGETGTLFIDQTWANPTWANPTWANPSVTLTNNHPIIEKALSKTILPTINIQLDWEKYPEREIEMLQDIMEIPLEEIVDWYINKFGITEIKKLMETSIKSYFNINKDEPETVAVTSPAIKKTKSKKK